MARTRNEAIVTASAYQTLRNWKSIRIVLTRVGTRELSVEFVDEQKRRCIVAIDSFKGVVLRSSGRARVSHLPQVLRAAISEENLSDRLTVWTYERGYIVDCVPEILSWKPGGDVRRTLNGFKAFG